MDGLKTILEIPAGLAILLPLLGVVVGMFFLTVAIMLLGRERAPRKTKVAVGQEDSTRRAIEREIESASVPQEPDEPDPEPPELPYAPSVPVAPVVRSAKRPAFAKQHNWYYVQGVPGRIPTLREALTAAGARIPNHLDWNRLDPKVRARIRREPFVEGQEEAPEASGNGHEPAPELETMRPVATVKATSERTTRLKPPTESVVVVSKRKR